MVVDRGKAPRMRLVFFASSLPESALGSMASEVAAQLRTEGAEVSFVHSSIERSSIAGDACRPWIDWRESEAVDRLLAMADTPVYFMGDEAIANVGSLHWLSRIPGVVCKHGEDNATEYHRLPDVPSGFVRHGWDWAMACSTGWICSDEGLADRAMAHCPGPVRMMQPPFDLLGAVQRGARSRGSSLRTTLVCMVHRNASDAASVILHGIAKSPLLATNIVCWLIGPLKNEEIIEISALARHLDVRLRLSVSMYDQLRTQSSVKASVGVVLAPPCLDIQALVMGSAQCGLPLVVPVGGWFDSLPGEVPRIADWLDIEAARVVLEELMATPGRQQQVGEALQLFANSAAGAQVYAGSLLALARLAVDDAISFAPARHFADLAARWNVPKTKLGFVSATTTLLYNVGKIDRTG